MCLDLEFVCGRKEGVHAPRSAGPRSPSITVPLLSPLLISFPKRFHSLAYSNYYYSVISLAKILNLLGADTSLNNPTLGSELAGDILAPITGSSSGIFPTGVLDALSGPISNIGENLNSIFCNCTSACTRNRFLCGCSCKNLSKFGSKCVLCVRSCACEYM